MQQIRKGKVTPGQLVYYKTRTGYIFLFFKEWKYSKIMLSDNIRTTYFVLPEDVFVLFDIKVIFSFEGKNINA